MKQHVVSVEWMEWMSPDVREALRAAELAFEAAAKGKRRHTCCREGCDKTEAKAGKFKKCSRCLIARFCLPECSAAAWKDGHEYTCTKIASPS